MDLAGQTMSAGQTRTASDKPALSGTGGGGSAPDRKADKKGTDPRRGSGPLSDLSSAATAGPASSIKADEKRTSPDKDSSPREKLVCKISGTADKVGKINISLAQSPGALLTVFGAREPDAEYPAPAPAFVDHAITHLLSIALGRTKPAPGADMPAGTINAMLQMMAALEPQNELEGAIAIQAAAIHHAALDCLTRAMTCEGHDFRQSHLGMANKCARTFATLVEALNRHRGKVTTQKVIVENVHVAAGGQAVVGAVAGAGSKQNGGVQAHEFQEGPSAEGTGEGSRRPALLSPQSSREALPAAGDERLEALQPSRRSPGQRRAEGQQKPLDPRQSKRRRNRGAASDARDAPPGARSGDRMSVRQ